MGLRKYHLILWLRQYVSMFRWSHVIGAVIGHMLITYGLLSYASEGHITSHWYNFIYFSIITYSTTGFGDLAPLTPMGRTICSLWVVPFGIMLYGAFFAKGVELFSAIRNKKLKGHISVKVDNHTVYLGWNKQTKRSIELTLADKTRRKSEIIVLGVIDDITNPFLEFSQIRFVKLDSYTCDNSLDRVSINTASKVIINCGNDADNFVIGVHLTGLDSNPHISTYFDEPGMIKSLVKINPRIECSCDRVAEMLTRTMQDHGSSVMITKLMDMSDDATTMVFQMDMPEIDRDITLSMKKLRNVFWTDYGSMITGVATHETGNDLELLPNDEFIVKDKMYIHYLAKERIIDFAYSKISI